MMKFAIFLNGPVGAGKTTLGRVLAERLAGGFLDGDDFSDPGRPWYCSILQTSRAVVRASEAILEHKGVVVIAYPLNCISWVYFRRRLSESGIDSLFVSLRASYATIVDERRGRVFSPEERDRIRVMIAEGYGARPFSDLVFDTDKADFAETVARLENDVGHMIAVRRDLPEGARLRRMINPRQ